MEVPKGSYSCVPSERNSTLINEVRRFPALYDTSDPNYYILAQRNKAWLQVAANCNVPAEHCHLRWKSLRKRYAKERRRFKEILQGQRRPWALFPKMSFLASSTARGRINTKNKKKATQKKNTPVSASQTYKQTASDDDMLILDDNDEILHTCKTVEVSEEDEYIYEHLDDPDSALEIMKEKPNPIEKQTAIRSGASASISTSTRIGGSGRIRKLTPKMQNSIIAKKLKQAQQIIQQSNNVSDHKTNKSTIRPKIESNANKKTYVLNSAVNQDKTRHIATVSPNTMRAGQMTNKDELQETVANSEESPSNAVTTDMQEPGSSEKTWSVKLIKLKGRNPIIFSPDELPKIKSFLKGESSPSKELSDIKPPPLLKVKSVENLNNNNTNELHQMTASIDNSESGNLDIIHSVGLMRKQTIEKPATERISHQAYSRAYSWNRPGARKTNKQTLSEVTEKPQPDSQTLDYEIEETWNDIKEENIDDYDYWPNYQDNVVSQQTYETTVQNDDTTRKSDMWNRLNEAKLDLVLYQQKLLEEQHRKNLEYMRKEHEMKMVLLRAELDLKRKQLNIMM